MPKASVIIELDDDGTVHAKWSPPNAMIAYGLIEIAKDIIQRGNEGEKAERPPKPQILVVPPGFGLPS